MTKNCEKIGIGTMDDPIRPGTTSNNWKVIKENETEFVIEILD